MSGRTRCGLMLLVVFLVVNYAVYASACNEVLCASVVSKCMLTQACKCDIDREKNKCDCCGDCAKCLGKQFERCCNCVGMCKDSDVSLDENDSVVGELINPFPDMFSAFAANNDDYLDFVFYRFPIHNNVGELLKKDQKNVKNNIDNNGQDLNSHIRTRNCTVAYQNQCTSNIKCKKTCSEIGSASYRFFFNGCCECVDVSCINYGINEIRCRDCPKVIEGEFDEEIADDPGLINTLEPDQTL